MKLFPYIINQSPLPLLSSRFIHPINTCIHYISPIASSSSNHFTDHYRPKKNRASTKDTGVGVPVTDSPTIANAPYPAEGNGTFSNYVLAGLVLSVPLFLTKILPTFFLSFSTRYVLFTLISGLPVTVAYWMTMSQIGPRKNEKVTMPGKNLEEYMTIKDEALRSKYNGRVKIPIQVS